MENKKQHVVVICGTTASGKTTLALQLAKELTRANILSVDSRQAYRELDIVTGKDIPEDLPPEISFYGVNLFEPKETANIADFVRYSKKIIADSYKNNLPLIIVGGSGLYLKAITQDLSDISIPPNLKLRHKLEKLSLSSLQQELKKLNLKKYSSLNHSDVMNPRRLIRHIEISLTKNISNSKDEMSPNTIFHWIGLSQTKEELQKNIHARVLGRLQQGAIVEVSNLLYRYPDHSLPIFSSLGVSQIKSYLEKKISLEELISIWTNAELDYARRQIVWFKKQSDIVWYDKNSDKIVLVADLKKIYTNNA
ncbi:MAG TPA: tRNA (adenosine(37)-N6)-dimethylallyltransferase MiaA [Candidatus Woesebacteria bacterium]|nr:tRNA (adenosine(37)-N6)-dimethylallyltransferase MiaA [Candidatus Woesebacteria bacterium]